MFDHFLWLYSDINKLFNTLQCEVRAIQRLNGSVCWITVNKSDERFHKLLRTATKCNEGDCRLSCQLLDCLQRSALRWIQSRRHGGLLGAKPPKTKLQAPQIKAWNTIHQLSFCKFLECQSPPHKSKGPHRNAKPPIENYLATVLVESQIEYYLKLCNKNTQNIKTLMFLLYHDVKGDIFW